MIASVTACFSLIAGVSFAQMGRSGLLTRVNQDLVPYLHESVDLGPADPGQILYISLNFKPNNLAALEAKAEDVSNPKSPNYRHFLNPQQIGQLFGQSQATVNAAARYLESQGFQVTLVSKDNMHILATGTVSNAERAFHVQIDKFHAISPNVPGRTDYYANKTVPELPSLIGKDMKLVSGLDNFEKPKSRILNPSQTQTIYNLAPSMSKGYNGQGRTIGISSWDGFRLSNVPLFYSQYNLPAPTGGVGSNITVETVDGGSGSGNPEGEGDLDIQMVLSQAPLCNLIVYDGGGGFVDTLTQEMNDDKADIITESYGWAADSTAAAAGHTLHTELTAEGITYLVASGDNGTNIGAYYYPDDEPDIVNVGGTIASVDSNGVRSSEVGWSGSAGGWVTVGDAFNVLPSWMKGNGVPTDINYRLIPDVALNAAGTSDGAYYFFYNGTLNNSFDGTSFASPVFAGGLGVAEQNLIANGSLPPDSFGNQRLGGINPLIYSQNGNSNIWYDVTSGSNGTLPNGSASNCTPGWDFVTGWGAINWQGFINSFGSSGTSGTDVFPASIGIYNSLGTSFVEPPNALLAVDGNYDTVQSVATATGQETALASTFQLSNVSTLSSLSVTVASGGAEGGTEFVYLYNNLKRRYDYVKAYPTTNAIATVSFTLPTYAPYINSSGQVKMIVRDLLNARLGSSPFQYQLDELKLSETN